MASLTLGGLRRRQRRVVRYRCQGDKEENHRQRTAQAQDVPVIFRSMLGLGNLHVKLGQVLSALSLPMPGQYRPLFQMLQSDVPNNTCIFDLVICPTLEQELVLLLIGEAFESVEGSCAGQGASGRLTGSS